MLACWKGTLIELNLDLVSTAVVEVGDYVNIGPCRHLATGSGSLGVPRPVTDSRAEFLPEPSIMC